MTSTMNAREIRRAYPRPIAMAGEGAKAPGAYCVGGALGAALGKTSGFPSYGMLADWLQEANPTLSWSAAIGYAYHIVGSNDHSNFKEAWDWLEEALTAPPTTWTGGMRSHQGGDDVVSPVD